MSKLTYSFDELSSGIVKTLKTLLPMIEKLKMHYLVINNCNFRFNKYGRMCVELNREGLSDKEYRELRARVAKCAKISKGLTNYIKQYKLKLEEVDVSVRSKQMKRLIGLVDAQIKQTQEAIIKSCEKKQKPVPDFNDLSQLSEKPLHRKTSLLVLDSLNKYLTFELENINYYEF